MLSNLITSLLISVCVGAKSFYDHSIDTNNIVESNPSNKILDEYDFDFYFTSKKSIKKYVSNESNVYIANNFDDLDYLNNITTNIVTDSHMCVEYGEVYEDYVNLKYAFNTNIVEGPRLYYRLYTQVVNSITYRYREIGIELVASNPRKIPIYRSRGFNNVDYVDGISSPYLWYKVTINSADSGPYNEFITRCKNNSCYISFSSTTSHNYSVLNDETYPYLFIMMYLTANRFVPSSISFPISSWNFINAIGDNYFGLYFPRSYNFHAGLDDRYVLYYGNFRYGSTIYGLISCSFAQITNPIYYDGLGQKQTYEGTFYYVDKVYVVSRDFLTENVIYEFTYDEISVQTFMSSGYKHFYKNPATTLFIYSTTLGVDLMDEDNLYFYYYYTFDSHGGSSYLDFFCVQYTSSFSPVDPYSPYLPQVFRLTRYGFSGLMSLLQAQILPGITLGTFLFLPFFAMIVMAILRTFRR